MKINNKGFAITAILYGLLILFALLIASYLLILNIKGNMLDKINMEVKNEFSNVE